MDDLPQPIWELGFAGHSPINSEVTTPMRMQCSSGCVCVRTRVCKSICVCQLYATETQTK